VQVVERAPREGRALQARYRALSTGQVTARVLEPGQLHWDPSHETLYLIAWCRLRQDLRVFAVHRFVAVQALNERCAPRPETRTQAALAKAFRVWRDDHVMQVRVRLCRLWPPVPPSRGWPSDLMAIRHLAGHMPQLVHDAALRGKGRVAEPGSNGPVMRVQVALRRSSLWPRPVGVGEPLEGPGRRHDPGLKRHGRHEMILHGIATRST
jgi:hypothetical protein